MKPLKCYYRISRGVTLKSYDEIYAMIAWVQVTEWYAELNSHPTEYYNKFNSEWHLTVKYEIYLIGFDTQVHPATMYNTWTSTIAGIAPWMRWPY